MSLLWGHQEDTGKDLPTCCRRQCNGQNLLYSFLQQRDDLKLKHPIFTGAVVSSRPLHADDFRLILVMPCYPQG